MVLSRSRVTSPLLLGVGASVVLLCGATSPARADDPSTPQDSAAPVVKVDPVAVQMRNDKARQLYLQGKQRYDARRYAEALTDFASAYALERLPDLLFEQAACHGRMGKMQQAFALHRRYVDSFRDPVKRLVAAARFGQIMRAVREAAKDKTPLMSKR